MTITIPPFVLGIIVTVLVEFISLIIWGMTHRK